MPGALLDEIRAQFGGVVPLVLERMHQSGELELHWPQIRSVTEHPEPLPREVMDALMAALGLRCDLQYCFVIHSLALVSAGIDRVEIHELGRHLSVPSQVPNHERWSRIVRLAWLAVGDGAHAGVAACALERACTPEEHAMVLRVCEVGAVLRRYVEANAIDVREEPVLAAMPDELRALIPEFIEFHTRLRERDDERPVCTACASCQQVRALGSQDWYPREAVAAMLPDDVLYSHGMCRACAQAYAGQHE